MSSSIVMVLFIFFLFSLPISIATTSSSSMIENVCSNTSRLIDSNLCVQVLRSDTRIASATNLLDLSIEIMQSGISNATKTRLYIENTMKKTNLDPNSKSALQECKMSYDLAIGSLKSALSEVKSDKNEYMAATYDLLIASTDNIGICTKVVSSKGFKDGTILSGNKAVPIFGLSAFQAIDAIIP